MREAPSLVILAELSRRGAQVRAYDPVAMDEARRALQGLPGLSFVGSMEAALQGADALVVVTEWKEFRNPDFDAIKAALKQPVIFDGRNLRPGADASARPGVPGHRPPLCQCCGVIRTRQALVLDCAGPDASRQRAQQAHLSKLRPATLQKLVYL